MLLQISEPGESKVKVHLFVMVLGYSRRIFARGYLHEKLGNLLDGHEAATIVSGLELQFTPAGDDPGAQAQTPREWFEGRLGLVRGLAVDVQDPGEGEDEI